MIYWCGHCNPDGDDDGCEWEGSDFSQHMQDTGHTEIYEAK